MMSERRTAGVTGSDGVESAVEDGRKKSPPGIEGMFANMQQDYFTPIKEVIEVGESPHDYFPKAFFPRRLAAIHKRLIMEEQLRENGRLNYRALERGDVLLSGTIDGKRLTLFTQVLSGFVRITQDASTGVNNWVSNRFGGNAGVGNRAA